MRLDSLPLSCRAEIVSVEADRGVGQRLLALGFLPGAPVRVVQVAPFGDPITIEIDSWRVSMRKSEAALIEIRSTVDAV